MKDSTISASVLIFVLVTVWATLGVQFGPMHAQGSIVQGVDLAGPYVIGNDEDRPKNEAHVRDFLWSHWLQHERGRITVIWISKEGRRATTTYSLEPDPRGLWNLKVTTLWPRRKGTDPQHNSIQFRVYSIRRIEPRRDGQSAAVFIPEGEKRSGTAYWLVFYDKDAKETGGV